MPESANDTRQRRRGTRNARSNRENGIAVYSAPSVKPGQSFLYFDPIDTLAPEAQARWAVPALQEEMIRQAVTRAGGKVAALA